MFGKLLFCLFLLLFPVAMVLAEDERADGPVGPVDPEAKMVGGMSVLGNKEAPMSLFIVPWKSSELGAETNLTRTLNERHAPVDRDVFLRELAFYEVTVSGKSQMSAAVSPVINVR